MGIDTGKAIVGGIVGTAAMTVMGIWGAPLMGIPAMNPAVMLAGAMGGMIALGWIAHFAIGIVLALGYALVAPLLSGAPVVRGAFYGVAPFLVAQTMVMPIMGIPFFSGSVAMVMGSLIGHLIYGAVVGGIYGTVEASARQPGLSTAQ